MEPAIAAKQEEDNAKSLLERASGLLQTDPQQALALLQPFESLGPDAVELAEAQFLRGCALQNLGRQPEAVQAFDKAQADFPTELRGPGFYLHRAISLNEVLEPQKALDAITLAEQTSGPFHQDDAGRGILFMQKAIALLGLGKAQPALEALTTASTLVQPGLAASNCWLQTGRALDALGQSDEALKAFDRSLAEAPPDNTAAGIRIFAAFQKANLLNRLQQNDQSLEALQVALDDFQKTRPAALPATFETNLLVSKANLLILLRQYDKAAAPLEEAERRRPELRTDVAFWVLKSNAYFYARRFEEALQQPPPEIANHPMVLALRGLIFNAKGDLDNGQHELQRAAASAAKAENDALAWTGVGLAESGLLNYQAAVAALEKARSLNPALAASDPTVNYALGNSLVALQRYAEAWEVLKNLPDSDDMLLAKALALQGLDKAPQALQLMERISPPLPTTPLLTALSYWIVLGTLMAAVERPEESLRAFETASDLAQQPAGAPLRLSAAVGRASALINLNRRDEAEALLVRATAEPPVLGTPSPGRGWWLLGGLLADQEKYEAALRAVNRAQSLEPDNIEIRLSKGKKLLLLEDYRQAEDVFKKALPLARNDHVRFEGLLNEGIALNNLELYEKAIEVLREAFNCAPDDAAHADTRLWMGLGQAYSSLDRLETARRTLQEGWRLNQGPNKSSDLALWVSSVLLKQERYGEAADFLQKAQLKTSDANLDLNLGIGLYFSEQASAAKQALQRAAGCGSQKAKEYLAAIAKADAVPEPADVLEYWFGSRVTPWRRSFGSLLVLLIMMVAALPVISKDAIHWLRWLNTGDNYKLGWICLIPLLLVFLAPVLKKISFNIGPLKFEAATPEATAKPNVTDTLVPMLQRGIRLPLSSSVTSNKPNMDAALQQLQSGAALGLSSRSSGR